MEASSVIRLAQGPVHYRESGQGRPIVFVHGLLVNGLLWRNVAPALSAHGRCIIPDWPLGAHPEPMAPDADLSPRGQAKLIADFLAELDLSDVTIVANDTGGAISQLLVTEHPERIGALVLTSCDAFDNFLPPMFRGLQVLARVPALLGAMLQTMRVRRLRSLPLAFGHVAKRPIPDAITDEWARAMLAGPGVRRDVAKLLRGVDPALTRAAADRLPGFDRPALVVWASEDRVFPVDHGRRLAALLPNARFEEIADSYAFIPEDQPDRLSELVGAFLSERTGATA